MVLLAITSISVGASFKLCSPLGLILIMEYFKETEKDMYKFLELF